MPGHVLSLTGGAVAYESKCALKISFSSRDADKELARTSYGREYLTRHLSTYLISDGSSLSLSLSLFFSLFLFLPSFYPLRTNKRSLPASRDIRRIPLYIGEDRGGINETEFFTRVSCVDARADIAVHSWETLAFKAPIARELQQNATLRRSRVTIANVRSVSYWSLSIIYFNFPMSCARRD